MTLSPGTTAALRKTCTAWAPPRREAAGEALPDDEAKAGVLGPQPGGEPDDPEDDEDDDDDDGNDKPADDDDGDDEPADDDDELDDDDDDDDELDDDERDGWSPAAA